MARGNKGTNRSSGKFRSTERLKIYSRSTSGSNKSDNSQTQSSQSDVPPSKRI